MNEKKSYKFVYLNTHARFSFVSMMLMMLYEWAITNIGRKMKNIDSAEILTQALLVYVRYCYVYSLILFFVSTGSSLS